jgi:hypothetical protein
MGLRAERKLLLVFRQSSISGCVENAIKTEHFSKK